MLNTSAYGEKREQTSRLNMRSLAGLFAEVRGGESPSQKSQT